MSKMKLPTAEQAEKLRSVGVDPEGKVIEADNGDYICCMCLRTRDDIIAHFKSRRAQGYVFGEAKPPTEEQAKLLRQSGIDTSKIAVEKDFGVVNEGLGRQIYCRNIENDCEINVTIVGTMWREKGALWREIWS